jgi:WD40 repeat protein
MLQQTSRSLLGFSSSSAVVAAACCDGSIRLWSTSSGAALAGHMSATACCMAWSSDGALVAAAFPTSQVKKVKKRMSQDMSGLELRLQAP